jgi:hypothetical protein
MVVLVNQDFLGVSREDAEEVTNRLDLQTNPIAGLIAHVMTDIPGGVHATDIWESEADFHAFTKDRLMPIAAAVAQERGISMDGMGQPTFRVASGPALKSFYG